MPPNVARQLLRIIGYAWASPNTLLGLVFAFGSQVQLVHGVIEIHGPLTRWFLDRCGPVRGASAMTLGHVVIAQNQACLDHSRKHERIHVRQYETYGPLFIPLYFLASFHAWRTGQDFYYDNFFEAEAYRLDGRN
jgi:hypothetical protein